MLKKVTMLNANVLLYLFLCVTVEHSKGFSTRADVWNKTNVRHQTKTRNVIMFLPFIHDPPSGQNFLWCVQQLFYTLDISKVLRGLSKSSEPVFVWRMKCSNEVWLLPKKFLYSSFLKKSWALAICSSVLAVFVQWNISKIFKRKCRSGS